MKQSHSAFTLIELCIVFVIIGLIAGGVLVGASLIKSAALRAVVTDINSFNAAANTFTEKYACMPGDCKYATTYFTASAVCAAWATSETGGVCNGNGNSLIETHNPVGSPPAPAATFNHPESFLFWKELALKEMLPGHYTGDMLSAGLGHHTGSTPRVNTPPTSISDSACYFVTTTDAADGYAFGPNRMFPISVPSHNVFILGDPYPIGFAARVACEAGVIPPEDAYNIDSKIDDGAPATGTVQTSYSIWGGAASTCHNFPTVPTIYNTAVTNPVCNLIFKADF